MCRCSFISMLVLIFIFTFQLVFATTFRPPATISECDKAFLTVREDFFKSTQGSPCEIVEAADDAIQKLKDAEEICINWIREDPRRYRGSSPIEPTYRVIMEHRKRAAAKCEYASPEPTWKPMSFQEFEKKLRDEGVFK